MPELTLLLLSSPTILTPRRKVCMGITEQSPRQLIFPYLFTTALSNMELKSNPKLLPALPRMVISRG
ncbi:hypothetical protein ES703_108654 [subsurface metagenome]